MRAWGEGHNKPHIPGHKTWGADYCDACVTESFTPWEAFVRAAEIAGYSGAALVYPRMSNVTVNGVTINGREQA